MNLSLYKNIHISDFILYLFMSISLGFSVIWIVFSILGQTLSSPINITITTFLLNTLLLIVVIIKLKKDKIKIVDLVGKPSKNTYIFEVPFTLIINFIISMD